MSIEVNRILPRSRSPQPAVDINGFFSMVGQALALYIKTEGSPINGTPIYIEEFAQQKLTTQEQTTDIITFRVASARMGATTNSGIIPKRPMTREQKTHPHKGSGYQVNVCGWWEQVQVQFDVVSRSNINANLMAEWFHVFMMKYAYIEKYFVGRGIDNFEFVERKDEPIDHNEGQEVYIRRLSYQFRLNRLYATESRLLTDIDLTVGIDNQVDSIDLVKAKQ